MNDATVEQQYGTAVRKPKELTLSEMIYNNREAGAQYIPGELRASLVQREMARHGFTEQQALAQILAFSKCVVDD